MVKARFKKKAKNYFLQALKRSSTVRSSANTCVNEIYESIGDLKSEPSLQQLAFTLKTMLNSTTWVSLSTLRFLASLVEIEKSNTTTLNKSQRLDIINSINSNQNITDYSDGDIYKAIYDELEYTHHNPGHDSQINVPTIECTIVLVSGVWNEIFSTAAFERGANYLRVTLN